MLLDVSSIIFSQSDFSFSNLHNNQLFQLPLCVTEVHKELVKASCTLEHCCCSRRRAPQKMTNNYLEKRARVCMQQCYQYNS